MSKSRFHDYRQIPMSEQYLKSIKNIMRFTKCYAIIDSHLALYDKYNELINNVSDANEPQQSALD